MGHYSIECPNLPTLPTIKNVDFSTRRFSTKEKGKTQVHLIKPMCERQENVLMG
jgi:hypothetical protein